MIGKSISHYEILEKLGQGGMGIVYKAHDTKLDRIVALKFLPSDIIASDADKQRFIREAKAAAALNHPNICTIYSVEEHNGHQFISMEYVDGVNLRQQSAGRGQTSELRGQTSEAEERGTLNLKHENAIYYAIQIAEALSEAHEKGIVHRDIKPDNIMVDSKNRIKVMDFGLAKFKGSINLTKSGGTIGTIQYMSPEQI
jgi:eukaryotic-like serine/threonine-protein kinase